MCWSGEASLGLAAAGIATTAYVAWKKESYLLWAPLGYFSLMELLQGFTYSVIDQCGTPANQIATLIGYLHIAFQPFFGCMIASYFIPAHIRKVVLPYAFGFAAFSAAFMIVQLIPFEWAGACQCGRILCEKELCSVSGNWHIAWNVPLNDIGEIQSSFIKNNFILNLLIGHGFPTYIAGMFLVPLLFGSWRFVLYHLMVGPLLARVLTDNPNEMPAVWCLLSIGILMIVIKTPLRKVMHVKSWPAWRYLEKPKPA